MYMRANITPDKEGIHLIFFLLLHENISCGHSLEAPQRGASNENPQHRFSWRNKKNIYLDMSLIWSNELDEKANHC